MHKTSIESLPVDRDNTPTERTSNEKELVLTTPLHENPLVLDYLTVRSFNGFELKATADKVVLVTDDNTLIALLRHGRIIKDEDQESVEINVMALLPKRGQLKKSAREHRWQYEPEVVDLTEALNTVNAFSDPAVKQRLANGQVHYNDLPVLFPRGVEIIATTASGPLGGIVESCSEVTTMFGNYYSIALSVILPTSKGCCVGKVSHRVYDFEGSVMTIDKLGIRPIVEDDKIALAERGEKFRTFTKEPTPATYTGKLTVPGWFRDKVSGADGRIMVDSINFAQIDADRYYETMRPFEIDEEATRGVVKDEDLWRCYNRVHGFSMRLKQWGWLDVEGIKAVKWHDNAFNQLVLSEQHKRSVLHLVKHYGTSFSDFIEGKSGGLVFLLHGPTGTGKAQPLDCMVQTPTGPVRMGDIQTGDFVRTPDGGNAKVLGVYPQGVRPCYELTFADGRKTKADVEHLWRAKTEDGRVLKAEGVVQPWDIVTTAKLRDRVHRLRKSRIPLTQPVENPAAQLPIDPWLLGILLGDGFYKYHQISISTADGYIVDRITELLPESLRLEHKGKYDYSILIDEEHFNEVRQGIPSRQGVIFHDIRKYLTELGLYGAGSHERFIPALYMNASVEQRMELIRGLMDSDGYVGKEGNLSYATSSEAMALDFQKLLWSLGGIAAISEKDTGYYNAQRNEFVDCKGCHLVQMRVRNPARFVSLPRKKERVQDTNQYSEYFGLRIENIERIEDQPTQCILIDHPDHLYLTDDYIVTHNTLTAEAVAETLHRPLYSVSVGELGTSPDQLEEKLRSILDLAFQWNAVLLLDEADIFMEARDTNNIERNAMVSIFLRLLEYYSGVLFLTTNRVQTFDPAFFSRISLAISYPRLEGHDRESVWRNVLLGSGVAVEKDFEETEVKIGHMINVTARRFDLSQLAEYEVNGRNIKTAVRIAQTMAVGEGRTVNQSDITTILAMTAKFNHEVKI